MQIAKSYREVNPALQSSIPQQDFQPHNWRTHCQAFLLARNTFAAMRLVATVPLKHGN
jgi:hypothetical protein